MNDTLFFPSAAYAAILAPSPESIAQAALFNPERGVHPHFPPLCCICIAGSAFGHWRSSAFGDIFSPSPRFDSEAYVIVFRERGYTAWWYTMQQVTAPFVESAGQI